MSQQIRRSEMFKKRLQRQRRPPDRGFDYRLNYNKLNLRLEPELYRVGVGEQGVLLVETYKSEILPYWRFKNPEVAKKSATKIAQLFERYKRESDFVGMDMSRKFLQMGFTRSRRFANHSTGRKYDQRGAVLPFLNDEVKAHSATIFFEAWIAVEHDVVYADLKLMWRCAFG